MASGAFNLTAQLNLRGPSNVRQVVADIRRQIGSINASVSLRVDPAATRSTSQLNGALRTLNSSFAATQTSANNAARAISNFGTTINSIGIRNLPQQINSSASAIAKLSGAASVNTKAVQATSTAIEELGKQSYLAVKRFAAFSIPTAAVFTLTNAVNKGIQAFIEYDQQFVKLQQVTGESAAGLKGLASTITGLATGLGVASSDITTVASTLAQAGLTARDTERALKALALSSLAPSFDSMNETVEGSIALMRQFGINAGDLEKALGSINSVAAKFAVEASDIITAIQRTGGVFATASKGVSEGADALNEFIAVFTSVRATTRESAETIATGLRTIFTRIQRGSTIDALKEFGVNLTDAEGKFVGAYKAVELLSKGLSSIDPRDLKFSQIVEELGGFRQIGKVIPLIQQFATAQDALKVAQKGQGSLAADAAKAQESLANRITKVREEFFALFKSIGSSDGFQRLVRGALDLSSALIKIADSVKGVLPVLATLAAFRGVSALTQFAIGFGGAAKARTKSSGGYVHKFATGGLVPGSGDSDSVHAMLTPGEFVMNKRAVKRYGAGNLVRMNKQARGGRIKDLLSVKPDLQSFYDTDDNRDMFNNVNISRPVDKTSFRQSREKYRDRAEYIWQQASAMFAKNKNLSEANTYIKRKTRIDPGLYDDKELDPNNKSPRRFNRIQGALAEQTVRGQTRGLSKLPNRAGADFVYTDSNGTNFIEVKNKLEKTTDSDLYAKALLGYAYLSRKSPPYFRNNKLDNISGLNIELRSSNPLDLASKNFNTGGFVQRFMAGSVGGVRATNLAGSVLSGITDSPLTGSQLMMGPYGAKTTEGKNWGSVVAKIVSETGIPYDRARGNILIGSSSIPLSQVLSSSKLNAKNFQSRVGPATIESLRTLRSRLINEYSKGKSIEQKRDPFILTDDEIAKARDVAVAGIRSNLADLSPYYRRVGNTPLQVFSGVLGSQGVKVFQRLWRKQYKLQRSAAASLRPGADLTDLSKQDREKFGLANAQGYDLEAVLGILGEGRGKRRANDAIDFLNGFSPETAALFGIPARIPTQAKLTITSSTRGKGLKGLVRGFASGGTVPAMVSNGEAYISPDIAKKIGYDKLNRMNRADTNGMQSFSSGGIGVFKGPGSGTSDSIGPVHLPEGSFIIREKATKALGLSGGGGVRKFVKGGKTEKVAEAVTSFDPVTKSAEEAINKLNKGFTKLFNDLVKKTENAIGGPLSASQRAALADKAQTQILQKSTSGMAPEQATAVLNRVKAIQASTGVTTGPVGFGAMNRAESGDQTAANIVADAQKKQVAAITKQIRSIDKNISIADAKAAAERRVADAWGGLYRRTKEQEQQMGLLSSAMSKASSAFSAIPSKLKALDNNFINTKIRAGIGGDVGFYGSMALGMLSGQGETFFGKKEANANNASNVAGFESGIGTLATGLATASSLTAIPVVGPFAAALTLGVTAITSWTNAVEAGKTAAEEFATTQRQKGIDDASDKLNKAFDRFQRDPGSGANQSAVIASAVDVSRKISDKNSADISIAERRKEASRSWIEFVSGAEKPMLGADERRKISEANARTAEPAADFARRLLETRIQSGKTIADISEMPDFKELTETIASANPQFLAAKNSIMSMREAIDPVTGLTKEQRIAQLLTIESTNLLTDAGLKAHESTMLAAKAMDEANKSGRELATSFDRLLNTFNQALARTDFELEAFDKSVSVLTEALTGTARVAEISNQDINILNNPQAYSQQERNAAADRASSYFGSDQNNIREMLKVDSTDFASSLIKSLNNSLKTNSGLDFERASQEARKTLVQKLEGAPQQAKDQALKEFNAIVQDVEKDDSGRNKVDLLAAQIEKDLGGSVSEAAKKARELAVSLLGARDKGLNAFIRSINDATQANLKASRIRFEAQDLATSRQDELRPILGMDNPSAAMMAARRDARVRELTGGPVDAKTIRENIERDAAKQQTLQQKLDQETNDDKRKELAIEIGGLTRNIEKGKEALDVLAKSSNVAAAAMNRIKDIQQSMQAQGDFLDKLATSTPEENEKLSGTFQRLMNNLSGRFNNPGNSMEARKAYNDALRSGSSPAAAQRAAFGVTAQERAQTLALWKEVKPILSRGKSAAEINEMEARVKTGVYGESGMFNNPMLRQMASQSISFIRDPRSLPEMNSAINDYNQSTASETEAMMQQAALTEKLAADTMDLATKRFEIAVDNLINRFGSMREESKRQEEPSDKPLPLAPSPVERARGGLIYASAGTLVNFQPKGTDTVPAMLSPGEFVINARSTAQHLPLLQAINSGSDIALSKTMRRGGIVYLAQGGQLKKDETIEQDKAALDTEIQAQGAAYASGNEESVRDQAELAQRQQVLHDARLTAYVSDGLANNDPDAKWQGSNASRWNDMTDEEKASDTEKYKGLIGQERERMYSRVNDIERNSGIATMPTREAAMQQIREEDKKKKQGLPLSTGLTSTKPENSTPPPPPSAPTNNPGATSGSRQPFQTGPDLARSRAKERAKQEADERAITKGASTSTGVLAQTLPSSRVVMADRPLEKPLPKENQAGLVDGARFDELSSRVQKGRYSIKDPLSPEERAEYNSMYRQRALSSIPSATDNARRLALNAIPVQFPGKKLSDEQSEEASRLRYQKYTADARIVGSEEGFAAFKQSEADKASARTTSRNEALAKRDEAISKKAEKLLSKYGDVGSEQYEAGAEYKLSEGDRALLNQARENAFQSKLDKDFKEISDRVDADREKRFGPRLTQQEIKDEAAKTSSDFNAAIQRNAEQDLARQANNKKIEDERKQREIDNKKELDQIRENVRAQAQAVRDARAADDKVRSDAMRAKNEAYTANKQAEEAKKRAEAEAANKQKEKDNLWINSDNIAVQGAGYLLGLGQGVGEMAYGAVNVVAGAATVAASPLIGLAVGNSNEEIAKSEKLTSQIRERQRKQAEQGVLGAQGTDQNIALAQAQKADYKGESATMAAASVGAKAMAQGAYTAVEFAQAAVGRGPIMTGEKTWLHQGDDERVQQAGPLGGATRVFQNVGYTASQLAPAMAGMGFSTGTSIAGKGARLFSALDNAIMSPGTLSRYAGKGLSAVDNITTGGRFTKKIAPVASEISDFYRAGRDAAFSGATKVAGRVMRSIGDTEFGQGVRLATKAVKNTVGDTLGGRSKRLAEAVEARKMKQAARNQREETAKWFEAQRLSEEQAVDSMNQTGVRGAGVVKPTTRAELAARLREARKTDGDLLENTRTGRAQARDIRDRYSPGLRRSVDEMRDARIANKIDATRQEARNLYSQRYMTAKKAGQSDVASEILDKARKESGSLAQSLIRKEVKSKYAKLYKDATDPKAKAEILRKAQRESAEIMQKFEIRSPDIKESIPSRAASQSAPTKPIVVESPKPTPGSAWLDDMDDALKQYRSSKAAAQSAPTKPIVVESPKPTTASNKPRMTLEEHRQAAAKHARSTAIREKMLKDIEADRLSKQDWKKTVKAELEARGPELKREFDFARESRLREGPTSLYQPNLSDKTVSQSAPTKPVVVESPKPTTADLLKHKDAGKLIGYRPNRTTEQAEALMEGQKAFFGPLVKDKDDLIEKLGGRNAISPVSLARLDALSVQQAQVFDIGVRYYNSGLKNKNTLTLEDYRIKNNSGGFDSQWDESRFIMLEKSSGEKIPYQFGRSNIEELSSVYFDTGLKESRFDGLTNSQRRDLLAIIEQESMPTITPKQSEVMSSVSRTEPRSSASIRESLPKPEIKSSQSARVLSPVSPEAIARAQSKLSNTKHVAARSGGHLKTGANVDALLAPDATTVDEIIERFGGRNRLTEQQLAQLESLRRFETEDPSVIRMADMSARSWEQYVPPRSGASGFWDWSRGNHPEHLVEAVNDPKNMLGSTMREKIKKIDEMRNNKDIAQAQRELDELLKRQSESAQAPAKMAKGGIVYASNGALIAAKQGTDTVPAMLTPGEFVVNRDMAQQHMPVLQAINSGHYSSGGLIQYLNNGGIVAPKYYRDGGLAINNSKPRGYGVPTGMTESAPPKWFSELDEKFSKFGESIGSSLTVMTNSLGSVTNQLASVSQELPREMSITSNINKTVDVKGVAGEWSKYQGEVLAMAGEQSSQLDNRKQTELSKWSEGAIPIV